MDLQSISVPVKPRTRSNVRQSKYGCFTCKARRVKCDETKPRCLRCIQACRKCNGYPLGAPNAPKLKTGLPRLVIGLGNPKRSIGSRFQDPPSFEQERLRALGCEVFANGCTGAKTTFEQDFWLRLVPKLTCSVDAVRQAAAAFGASYEHQVLDGRSSASGLTVLRRVSAAVNRLQEDLVSFPDGPLPVIVACILLACAETLEHENTRALKHVRGAFAALALQQSRMVNSYTSKDLLTDHVSHVCQKLDVQVAGYVLGTTTGLPSPLDERLSTLEVNAFSMDKADKTLTHTLWSCYHFISQARKYKYRSSVTHGHLLLIEEGRQLANLTSWLSWFRRSCRTQELDADGVHGLILQCHCLSALILAGTILSPYETSYDRYCSQFQLIVEYAEKALEALGDGKTLPTFSMGNGLIQPLFLTAVKYRNSEWRLKALSLLWRCGREGPWCSYIHAASAEAVIRAEEAAALIAMGEDPPTSKTGLGFGPKQVEENCRVASNTILDIDEGSNGFKKVVVKLSRCRDMSVFLACSGIVGLENESTHWLIWHETYDLSGYR